MTEKRKYIITDRNRAHILNAIEALEIGDVVRVSGPIRTLPQNDLMWSRLGDVAKQVNWYGKMLSDKQWKDVFTASLKAQEVVPNLDGTGFVVCGASTSNMTKQELSDVIEVATAFGAQHNVKWTL